jgi:hypothetical protein
MKERDFLNLDRKKLNYEDIVKFKWKTIQYLVDNKKMQMEMLTKNMKTLIQEVKNEMRRDRAHAYDIELPTKSKPGSAGHNQINLLAKGFRRTIMASA